MRFVHQHWQQVRSPRARGVGAAVLASSLWLGSGAVAQGPPAGAGPDSHALLREFEHGVKGVLAVRGVQGTAGGASVAGDEVEVTLFHRNLAVKQLRGTLDEQGVWLVGDVPVGPGVSPLVRIRHAGVQYQDAAPDMSPALPNARVDITVYEVTDAKPTWKVAVRHAVVERRGASHVVSETIVAENPTDRTWMGDAPDAQQRRATVVLSLPPGAADIELVQGFHGWCCSSVQGATLAVQMPFMPGKMTYKLAYRVPSRDGLSDLRTAMPVEISRATYFVPSDSAVIEPAGLAEVTTSVGGGALRMFEASGVEAGRSVGVVVGNPAPEPEASPAKVPERGLAGLLTVGAAAALVGGAVLAWRAVAKTGTRV